jgi:hypothetical protein
MDCVKPKALKYSKIGEREKATQREPEKHFLSLDRQDQVD